ncbi:hypothetical protein [Brevibacillus migulae]|uniref:hypothetical protein n=1 Tax=Brevibacillus migulae TaxID=1644114 RepID=UPI00106E5F42|nr:hypothetical protein [Brevibacillus migulae]
MNEETYQENDQDQGKDQDQDLQAGDETTLMGDDTEALTGNTRMFEQMRNVAQVARDAFPELIDYYDPEKDEIV